MTEEWRDIKGYEGLYQISNLGRVMSFNFYRSSTPKILTPTSNGTGYFKICLNKNRITKQFLIHRLVAEAFLPNTNNYEMVNHKDENKANNRVDNLEWCSRSYNQTYSIGLHPERKQVFANNFKGLSPFTKRGTAHTCFDGVVQFDYNGNRIATYDNFSVASIETNIDNTYIRTACYANARIDRQRKRKPATAGGYVWRFEDANIKTRLVNGRFQKVEV